jgi:hypothetical protein
MFSDVRNYPRYQIQLDNTDPVPKFIPRQWRGYSQQARDAINRYKKYDFHSVVNTKHTSLLLVLILYFVNSQGKGGTCSRVLYVCLSQFFPCI